MFSDTTSLVKRTDHYVKKKYTLLGKDHFLLNGHRGP